MATRIETIIRLSGPDIDKIVPVTGERISIGRQSGNDLILDNPEVSRRHAVIEVKDDGCTITDMGSSNGTRLEGEKITPNLPCPLKPGMPIKIGPFNLILDQKTIEVPESPPPVEEAPPKVAKEKPKKRETPPLKPPKPPISKPTSPPPEPIEEPPVPQGLSLNSQKLIQYLPGIFHTDFMSRFLGLFEATLLPLEWTIDNFDLYLDPDTAPSEFLPWLANWYEISFGPTWTEAQRRLLLKEAASIYARRGTCWALSRILEIYTGLEPTIIDADEKLDPHTFRVILPVTEASINRDVIERIIDTSKPAHTSYRLELKPS